jgi:hypothetical protein
MCPEPGQGGRFNFPQMPDPVSLGSCSASRYGVRRRGIYGRPSRSSLGRSMWSEATRFGHMAKCARIQIAVSCSPQPNRISFAALVSAR